MAKSTSYATRKARAARRAAALLRMQQDIDRVRGEIWNRHLGAIGPGVGDYIKRFNEAWLRSARPNVDRDDMMPNGNYRATGRDINGYDQDELDAWNRAGAPADRTPRRAGAV